MPSSQQRGLPVIYVAGSARELPAELREWLGEAVTHAVAAPDVYDMLAQLARGRKFSAIIVSIAAVDWAELEFFDHGARLAGRAPVYAVGDHAHRAKLESAYKRGARPLDLVELKEHLACHALETAEDQRAPSRIAGRPDERLIRPAVVESPEPEPEPFEFQDSAADAHGLWEEETVVSRPVVEDCASGGPIIQERFEVHERLDLQPPPDSTIFSPAERVVEGPVDIQVPATPEPSPEPAPVPLEEVAAPAVDLDANASTAGNEPVPAAPSFRIADPEPIDTDSPPAVFPWNVNPNRPRRTPPRSAVAPAEQPAEEPAPDDADDSVPFRGIKLTPEEMAALMGDFPRRNRREPRS